MGMTRCAASQRPPESNTVVQHENARREAASIRSRSRAHPPRAAPGRLERAVSRGGPGADWSRRWKERPMRKPASMKALEELGRVRLSEHFFMREMLYSEIANFHGIPNIPDDPDLAIAAGTRLCEDLLEPLHATFGHVSVRSAFRLRRGEHLRRRPAGQRLLVRCDGVEPFPPCVGPAGRRGLHGGDRLHRRSLVHPTFRGRYALGGARLVGARPPAVFGHDVLRRKGRNCAFNLRWHEKPARRIEAFSPRRLLLTKPGCANHAGDHSSEYPGFPKLRRY